MFFNPVVSTLVKDGEGLLEFLFLVVIGRWQVLQDRLNEVLGLSFVQVPVVITIKVDPDLVDLLSEEAIAFELRRQLSGESVELQEESIVDEHLNIAWLALPSQ